MQRVSLAASCRLIWLQRKPRWTSLLRLPILSRAEIAQGIRDVVNETMASAARVHIAERGKDPRRYALLATGGGGPLHGADVARKLGLKRMISPASAGVASAIGLLIAPRPCGQGRDSGQAHGPA